MKNTDQILKVEIELIKDVNWRKPENENFRNISRISRQVLQTKQKKWKKKILCL